MNQQLLNDISKYVEDHIGEFHANRIAKLQTMNLKEMLSSKNPYMYKAKNLVAPGQLVESLAAATMSSAEESIFGNWLETVAIFVAKKVYNGYKSSAKGVDLEFDKDGVHYFVSIKSGPRWSNTTSMEQQKKNFVTAVNTFNTSRSMPAPTMCIEGCCYGNDNKGYKDSTHIKCCGEKFWSLISGEPTLFVDIVEPLGYKAKQKNDEYYEEYIAMVAKFTRQFVLEYCNEDGRINWEKIVRLNAAIKVPKEPKPKKETKKSSAKKSKKTK